MNQLLLPIWKLFAGQSMEASALSLHGAPLLLNIPRDDDDDGGGR